MFALTIQTGLRISELAGLDCGDITLGTGAHVHTIGKGRKERRTPLIHPTRAVLKAWQAERGGTPTDPLFPTTTGKRMSRDAIERRLTHHLALSSGSCPSIADKHVTMHTLRHTAAMRLLLAGNDITVIARMARTRADRYNEHLPPRRHEPQTTSHRQDQAAGRKARPLSAPRRLLLCVPRGPLIMPTQDAAPPPLTSGHALVSA